MHPTYAAPLQPQSRPLPFRLLATAATSWDPASLGQPTLNVRLDGCICPSEASPEGARIAYGHVVVLDDFIEDSTRHDLLHFLLHGTGASAHNKAGRGSQHEPVLQQHPEEWHTAGVGAVQLPPERWERRTTDMVGAAPTWGVKQHVHHELAEGHLPAMQEVHARLCRLYPECDIAHLPSEAIQLPAEHGGQGENGRGIPEPDQQQQQHQEERQQRQEQQQQEERQQQQQQQQEERQQQEQQGQQQGQGLQRDEQEGAPAKRSRADPPGGSSGAGGGGGGGGGAGSGADGGRSPTRGVDCSCFVANAAVEGDTFRFHVDADPTSFPDGSPWHEAYGDYFNGEPGKPLLVSLLLYLNDEWEREWGAETLFLDGQTDTGIFVAPRPCRAVLFDQDVMHRVTAPSAAARGRPRFSLVWKLALLPRSPCPAGAAAQQALCLARPEWGPPVSFGSAARVDAVKRQLVREQQRQGQRG